MVVFVGHTTFGSHVFEHAPGVVVVFVSGFIATAGRGMFQANTIQFGLDQLLEAPTQKLIAFIQWYYWAWNVGYLIFLYLGVGSVAAWAHLCATGHSKHFLEETLGIPSLLSITLIAGAALLLFRASKKSFYIQRAGLNPFKNIYRVLRYSWKHKVPENRSAFTYWEEDIPPRIDLGKDKYGGPFTTEEVEDTKTFLRILPLLLSLFGYHLAGDGYSAPEQLQRSSCPSLPVLLLVASSPLHVSTLVVVVGIPLYRLVIRNMVPRFGQVLMLTRMWLGLFLSLVQVILYIIVVVNHDTAYWKQHHSLPKHHHAVTFYSPTGLCFLFRAGIRQNDTTCEAVDDPIDNTYLWFIVPQLLNGFSSLLVSMSVLEFICAQAPRTTQGLLIGLWYASFSIKCLVVGVPDTFILKKSSWLIFEGVKGFLILVSLVLFSCVSRHYRYRQRDEIVNVQWMIEDTFDRRLDQEEAYMQERRALFGNKSSYKSYDH